MSRIGRLARAFVCVLGASAICACTEEPTEPVDFENGIWMLSNVVRTQEGSVTQCRPMLFDFFISDTTVELSTRAYPCAEDDDFPSSITLRREGSSLYAGNDQVGTLLKRRLNITLPHGVRTISWDLDRPDTPWQETGYLGTTTASYSAQLDKRPNDSPVPISQKIDATEDNPVTGWAHAANLAETDLQYMLVVAPSDGWIEMFDTHTGRFRVQPNKDFAGRDEFRFFVVANSSPSPTASVVMTYAGEPDPPVANDTVVTTLEDQSITFFPDGKDPDDELVKLELVSSPKHGMAVRTGLSVTYTPESEFSGTDGLDYVIDDGTTKSNIGHIDIFVNPLNDSPVAMNQNIAVTGDSATPFTLQVLDIDSTELTYFWDTLPKFGTIYGAAPNLVYVPKAGMIQGTDQATYHVFDEQSESANATVQFTISPGSHVCTLQTSEPIEDITPLWSDGSQIYYRFSSLNLTNVVGATDGTGYGAHILQYGELDTVGFDNNKDGVRRTTFFNVGADVYFTTSTTGLAIRMYRTDGATMTGSLDLFPPGGNNLVGGPSIGDPLIEGTNVYLPIQWPTTNQEYTCVVQLIDSVLFQTQVVQSFTGAKGSCSGLWTYAGAQYMFVGPILYRFANMQSPPVLVRNLGNAKPTSWMVEAGGKLFFQTRTDLATGTQIDLWVTDGTTGGTLLVKTLETEPFEFDIFSPVTFLDKLYFAHRKSLWSSDGTAAGTNVVATIPVSSVVGDGAIGTITPMQGKLYFLATSDAAGREPWVSDGMTAGTKLLRDIRVGALGSSMPSKNAAYFQEWKGQTLFVANDGGANTGLWTTDGTSSGTKSIAQRPMRTIVGIRGDNLVFHDGHFFYTMYLN